VHPGSSKIRKKGGSMASRSTAVKKIAHRIMIILFSLLEVLGLPRVPGKNHRGEAEKR
jgi:hypothetical protein